ncbi:MAG: peptide deformylase [Alphaproteobacteria bacterium]|nr:peptide deformylase [Alphaproteobacteria bacterium]
MAILKIARMGNPILLQRCAPVPDPTDPEIRRLAADMVETMDDIGGAGLAAPQVHVPLRLFVFRVRPERVGESPEDLPLGPTVLINPELEPVGEEIEQAWEGCLSIPGLRGSVPRAARVRYRGVGLAGEPIERVAAGFHARVVQHEYDHLDGILYPMRMTDLALFGFTEELMRAAANLARAEEEAEEEASAEGAPCA